MIRRVSSVLGRVMACCEMIDLLRGKLGQELGPGRVTPDIGFHQIDIARGGMRAGPSASADNADDSITEISDVVGEQRTVLATSAGDQGCFYAELHVYTISISGIGKISFPPRFR